VNDEVSDRDQATEDQYCDPEPEGQCSDQDFPQGFDDGMFNPAL
jgi:hypothetical protein